LGRGIAAVDGIEVAAGMIDHRTPAVEPEL
jgi:hypothetical protein